MKMMKMIGGIRGIPIKKESSRTENGPSLKKKPPSRAGIFQPPFEDNKIAAWMPPSMPRGQLDDNWGKGRDQNWLLFQPRFSTH